MSFHPRPSTERGGRGRHRRKIQVTVFVDLFSVKREDVKALKTDVLLHRYLRRQQLSRCRHKIVPLCQICS